MQLAVTMLHSADLTRFVMRIRVDADAIPAAIKDTLYRAAERLQIAVTLALIS
jgi:hypothetical protein